jgi:peptidoglycan LD-endopeptidase CwlK
MANDSVRLENETLKNQPSGTGFLDAPLTRDQFERSSVQRFGLRFSPDDLDQAFREKLDKTIADCDAKGVIMVPYIGIRDPWEQARLWRQSRSGTVVRAAIKDLKDQGADFLAKVLEDVGPQDPGPKRTGALPGFSWHQWGEACDCYRRINGGADWDTKNYEFYAKTAEDNGLTAGGYWNSLKDWPHVQLRATDSPLSHYSIKKINEVMIERFGVSTETSPNVV